MGLDQDYRFGHPGTDSIAEPQLRCNVFRTAFTFDPAFFAGPVFRSGPVKAFRQRQRPLCRNRSDLASRQLPAPAAPRSPRYPPGTGSAQILLSMSPNSRRFRCPWANSNQ